MGLLGEIYSFGNRTRNKLRGLLDDPKGYLQQTADQTANTLRDMTGANETAQQFALRDKINAGDKNALAQYRNLEKTIQNKLFDVALNFNPAAVGMTAWHGSPHKFDKFDLAKIGTGEGAQAYGHGAYLAEHPSVAKEYAEKLSSAGLAKNTLSRNAGDFNKAISDAESSISGYKELIANGGGGDMRRAQSMLSIAEKKLADLKSMQHGTLDEAGQLYKTDIPDEAVARFLDWDKPLSQQAPEVQKAMRSLAKHTPEGGIYREMMQPFEAGNSTGESLHRAFMSDLATTGNGAPDRVFSMMSNEYGIPGIRYLDGGSRAAGQGSSNFVVFDPNMIRILERNGQATGAQPWKPGEWGGLLK